MDPLVESVRLPNKNQAQDLSGSDVGPALVGRDFDKHHHSHFSKHKLGLKIHTQCKNSQSRRVEYSLSRPRSQSPVDIPAEVLSIRSSPFHTPRDSASALSQQELKSLEECCPLDFLIPELDLGDLPSVDMLVAEEQNQTHALSPPKLSFTELETLKSVASLSMQKQLEVYDTLQRAASVSKAKEPPMNVNRVKFSVNASILSLNSNLSPMDSVVLESLFAEDWPERWTKNRSEGRGRTMEDV